MRTALQKHLTARLATLGATYIRFLYACPLAIAYLAGLAYGTGRHLPPPNLEFALHVMIGGGAQIAATALLLALFRLRNFAVGTTYSKTEIIQTALFAAVILGEPIGLGPWAGIAVSFAGVAALSMGRSGLGLRGLVAGFGDRSALYGLASGAGFAVSAVSYRAASLALDSDGIALPAAMTLAWVTAFQTVAMGIWLGLRHRDQLLAAFGAWRSAFWVGVTGMLGSACWFTAFTLQNAALVRAVGQVELVFIFLTSRLIFRERSDRVELAGIILVVAGILILLLARSPLRGG